MDKRIAFAVEYVAAVEENRVSYAESASQLLGLHLDIEVAYNEVECITVGE